MQENYPPRSRMRLKSRPLVLICMVASMLEARIRQALEST